MGRNYKARVENCTIICLVKLLLVFDAAYFNVRGNRALKTL